MRSSLFGLAVLMAASLGARAGAAELPEGCSPLTILDPAHRPALEAACASSGVIPPIDPPECAVLLFTSYLDLLTQSIEVPAEERKATPTIAAALAIAAGGSNPLSDVTLESLSSAPPPLVPLAQDPCDEQRSNGDGTCGPAPAPGPHAAFGSFGPTLNQLASDEQEALLGCGPLHGGDCEATGLDLFAAHRPTLTQSWVGFDGTCVQQSGFEDWHLANGGPQPGTIGYPGAVALDVPGARSPLLPDGATPNPDYVPNVDGSTGGLVIPAEFGASAGRPFASEMAALSFNLQMILVALSAASDPPALDELDRNRPFAFYDPNQPDTFEDRGRCSYAQPQHCRVMRAIVVPEADAGLGAAASALALAALAARRPRARRRSQERGVL